MLLKVPEVSACSIVIRTHVLKCDEYHRNLVKSPVSKHTSQQHNHITRCIYISQDISLKCSMLWPVKIFSGKEPEIYFSLGLINDIPKVTNVSNGIMSFE